MKDTKLYYTLPLRRKLESRPVTPHTRTQALSCHVADILHTHARILQNYAGPLFDANSAGTGYRDLTGFAHRSYTCGSVGITWLNPQVLSLILRHR